MVLGRGKHLLCVNTELDVFPLLSHFVLTVLLRVVLRGKSGSERLYNMFKVTQLLCMRGGWYTGLLRFPEPVDIVFGSEHRAFQPITRNEAEKI